MPMMEDNPDTSKELLTEHYRWHAIEQAHRVLKMIDKRWLRRRSASRSFSSQIVMIHQGHCAESPHSAMEGYKLSPRLKPFFTLLGWSPLPSSFGVQ